MGDDEHRSSSASSAASSATLSREGRLQRARELLCARHGDEALEMLLECVRANPRDSEALYETARAYCLTGELDKAVA